MRLDFAYATRSVLYVMAAIMAAAAVVAFAGLKAGLQEEAVGEQAEVPHGDVELAGEGDAEASVAL